mgnify:CR=1 FL=1
MLSIYSNILHSSTPSMGAVWYIQFGGSYLSVKRCSACCLPSVVEFAVLYISIFPLSKIIEYGSMSEVINLVSIACRSIQYDFHRLRNSPL